MLKNKTILALVFSLFLLNPVFGVEGDVKTLEIQGGTQETLDKEVGEALNQTELEDASLKEVKTPKVKDLEEMTPNVNDDIRKEVVGDTEKNISSTIKKFLFAMIGVLLSSFLIFGILIFMRKMNLLKGNEENPQKEETKSQKQEEYISDGSETGALKIFFDKTLD